MNWVHTATLVVHVLLAAAIVGLVLLQRGKGADAGAGFGSGASGTVFGARGSASFLSRTTATMAALFFATSLALAYMGGRPATSSGSSVIDRVQIPAETPAVTPAPIAPEQSAPAPAGVDADTAVENAAPAPAETPAPAPAQ